MYKEFRNESWHDSKEKESYLRTLKTIRFHKNLDRQAAPTTTLIFVSRLSDPSIRQHFEDSSKHFKTYNLYTDISEFFSVPLNFSDRKLQKTPFWVLNILDSVLKVNVINFFVFSFLPESFKNHFSYRKKLRSLTEDDIVKEISLIFQIIGLTRFSKLNVVIGANDEKNVKFGIKFLCKSLNDSKLKSLLANKNIMLPEDYQTFYGAFKREKNKLVFKATTQILDINKSLMNYLERKSLWVLDRKRVKDLIDIPAKEESLTLIIGRRILKRGHDPINESSLIQSYDFKVDIDHKLIQMILKKFIRAFRQSNINALIIIENYPNLISDLIVGDEELRLLLHGTMIALACIEPDSKEIYTFEGDKFVQRSLVQIKRTE